MKEKRRRLYEIVFYDNFDEIKKSWDLTSCTYYHVFHNKDTYDDDVKDVNGNIINKKGDLKKPHYHLLLYFNDGITLSSLCKRFNIKSENLVSFWNSNDKKGRKDYRIRYLIHYKSKDSSRYEYNINDIITNDDNINKYFDLCDDKKSTADLLLIFDYFDSHENIVISYRTFLNFVFNQGLWGTYRYNATIFNRLLDEHNANAKELAEDIFKVRIK